MGMKIYFEELAAPKRVGGIESATAGLVSALARCGFEVNRRLPEHPDSGDARPDCVHIHGIWSPRLARQLMCWRRRGVAVVVSVHGMLEPWAFAHKRAKKKIAWVLYQKRVLDRASILHATSEREAENLRKLGLQVPIAMIPWGVQIPEERWRKGWATKMEMGEEAPKIADGESSRASVGQATTIRTALFVGRIFAVKGLPMLVEAWAKVRPVGWRMRIVGPDEGGHRAEVEAMVQKAGLGAEFEFVGPLGGVELVRAYQESELFVLPSHTENFGLVVGEAMAHGLAVITTHGAPWELLEKENCGWWIPVDADCIAAALDDAMRRAPDELAAMGARGRAVAEERFSWERNAQEMSTCYSWLLRKGMVPACVRGYGGRPITG